MTSLTKWLIERNLPRIHGCVWDRDCRRESCPPRISILTRRHMVWVDLPGKWRAAWFEAEPTWHLPHFGHHKRST